jgi:hypothetical protein
MSENGLSQRMRHLMGSIRESIAEIEGSLVEHEHTRALARVLAHLWSAHDELELLSPVEDARRRQRDAPARV